MAIVNPADIIDLFREDIDTGSFNVAALVVDESGCDSRPYEESGMSRPVPDAGRPVRGPG